MTALELPALRAGAWYGVTVESAELAGSRIWVTSVREAGQPIKRRWLPDEGAAVAYGATRADELGLPLFLLGAGEADE